MGIPNQPSAATATAGKILCCLYLDMGIDPQLLRRSEQLLWGSRHPILPRCIRGGRDAGLRSLDVSGAILYLVFRAEDDY